MPSPNSLHDDYTIHNQGTSEASTQPELDAQASSEFSSDKASSDASTSFQGDVYEQLAQLEYIYVDKTASFITEESSAATLGEPLSLGDIFEGLAQLATMGIVEVTDIVEAVHREIILRPLGRLDDRNLTKWQRGLTGRIYSTVRYAMLVVGTNLTSGLWLYNNIRNQKNVPPLPRKLRRLVNILNGVMGDHLVNHHNPLAVPMALYDRSLHKKYSHLQQGEISGRIIILCHGLCMSHLTWNVFKNNNLGERISRSQPKSTILYLNYNTGRHISSNGRNLSQVLQDLVNNNPGITQIDLIGHSMGGLVARSALFYGKEQGFNWVKQVHNLVTLGSPHQGASLERIGSYVQDRIAKLPFAGSLAKLGDLRSAGIIDLRYGSIRDADWKSLEGRSVLPPEFRHPTQLPLHVNTYLIAATLVDSSYDSKMTGLLGDGLVTIESALGEHTGEHALTVPEERKAIFYGLSHYNLLYSKRVHKQVIEWLLDNE
ncbi:pimeloyl-ACP methyl ester carboxylesterase [Psychrobacter sp. PL15]|uniref:PGAP1-like alpha/beta domain-containing protein n=1 Tax=Psychrobacter sp. PL15 TaxID=3071719 RepID=UPI002E027A53|nr:pimeloyl-ACP methyl ester carboxylesterase [Psychrobacter sp. PL15]